VTVRINHVTQFLSPSATISNKMVDDADSAVQYLPSALGWNTARNTNYNSGTLHFSDLAGATASLSFSGEALAVYGTTSPDHGDLQVQIDGNIAAVKPYTGVSELHAQVGASFIISVRLAPDIHFRTCS
jgi:hypothetical protein